MQRAEHKIDSPRTYLLIYVMLMLLLAATVWSANFDLGAVNVVVSMAIAVAKALLVILFFMHVRHGSGLVWIFAGASFLWLALLLGLTMTDYASRELQQPTITSTPSISREADPAIATPTALSDQGMSLPDK